MKREKIENGANEILQEKKPFISLRPRVHFFQARNSAESAVISLPINDVLKWTSGISDSATYLSNTLSYFKHGIKSCLSGKIVSVYPGHYTTTTTCGARRFLQDI